MERLKNIQESGTLVRRESVFATREPTLIDGPSAAEPLANAIRRQLETPFIHKWTIFSCVLASTLLAWAIIALWPKTFESTAKIIIRVGRESVGLDPSATVGGQTLLIQKTRQEEVVSALDLLGSEKVANNVVERIGPAAILDGFLPGQSLDSADRETAIAPLLELMGDARKKLVEIAVAAGVKSDLSLHENSLIQLKTAVEFYSPQDSSIISISGNAKSPQMAQAIAQNFAEAFVEEHVNLNRPHGSATFFEAESRELEETLNALVSQRANFMSDSKMVSIESVKSILSQQLSAICQELLDAGGRAERVKAEIKNSRALLGTIPKEFVNERKQRNNLTRTELQKQLFELEIEEAKLRETRTADNPELVRLRRELNGLRGQIASEEKEKVDENYGANPTYLTIESNLRALETQQAGLNSFIATKEEQKLELESQVDELLEKERKLVKLNRDIAVSEQSLNALQVRAEQARVVDELGTQNISNIRIFQPASLKERPKSPNKRIVAVLLPAFGLIAGLSIAFSRELFSTKLRHTDHLRTLATPERCHSIPKHARIARRRNTKEIESVCREILSSATLGPWESAVVAVIGASPGCGASTMAMSLARVSNRFASSTNLVDADRNRRSVTRAFRHAKSLGLAELVSGSAKPDECIHSLDEQLTLTPTGSTRAGSVFKTLGQNGCMSELCGNSDLVVIDLPPASDSHEAATFASCVDFVVLVLEAEKTQYSEAQKLVQRLEKGNAELIGLVLNKRRNHLPGLIRKLFFGSHPSL